MQKKAFKKDIYIIYYIILYVEKRMNRMKKQKKIDQK